MNKKAIFFTITSIFMVSILVLAFSSDTYITLKNKIPVTKHRVQLANRYVRNVKNIYLNRALYATGYRALYALAMDINESGVFYSDQDEFENNFRTLVLEARINGVSSSIMEGKTIIDTLGILENLSWDAHHINTTFEKDKISIAVFQDDITGPWQVGVNMSINYFVDADIAEWNISGQVVQSVFSIVGLDDPLYLVGTIREYTNKIEPTPLEIWNLENLTTHITNRTYRHDPTVPNFLMRFYGVTSESDCCGIESLVYKEVEDDEYVYNSFIDCAYWGGGCGSGIVVNISGFEDLYPDSPDNRLRLDSYHANVYNVTDYIS